MIVSDTLPDVSEMAPAKFTTSPGAAATVSVTGAVDSFVTLPDPYKDAMFWLMPLRFSVAPLATVTDGLDAIAFATPVSRVPPLMAVAPS